MGRSSRLSYGPGGRLSSSRSKTGDPACSGAMSEWVRGRKAGIVPAAVYAILGKCRAMARMHSAARLQNAAGNTLKAQALTARAKRGLSQKDRTARAKELAGFRKVMHATKTQPREAPRMPREQRGTDARKWKAEQLRDVRNRGREEQAKVDAKAAAKVAASGKEVAQVKAKIKATAKKLEATKAKEFTPPKHLAARVEKANAKVDAAKARLAEIQARHAANPSQAKPTPAPTPAAKPSRESYLARIDRQHAEAKADLEAAQKKLAAKLYPSKVHMKLKGEVDKHKSIVARLEDERRVAGSIVKNSPERKAKAARLLAERKARNAAFALKREPEKQAAAFKPENSGAGKTGFMFDMKKGDKPGQTSIFDKVATVHTHDKGATAAQLARHVPKVSGGSPQAVIAKAQETLARRSKTAEKLKAARDLRNEHASPETHGKVGGTYQFKADAIHFDPERFQYKLGAQGAHGTTSALGDVKKWDPELAGVVSVWKDPANGKTYVVNGHHRLDLAKKLGVSHVTAKYLDAKTAKEARAKGAMVNIAEGRGSAVDAAQFFRDTGVTHEAATAKGLSLREHTAAQGLAMAGLPETAFKRVVSGEITPARAAIVGGSGLSHEQQAAVFKLLDKPGNKRLTDGSVKNLTDAAKAAGSRVKETRDLFGTTQEEESLIVHRAKLEDSIKRSLSADQRLFGLVSKSKAAQQLAERGKSSIDVATTGKVGKEASDVLSVFDQLKHRHPSISRPLNEAATRLAEGDSPKSVEADTRKKVTAAIRRILSGDEAFAG